MKKIYGFLLLALLAMCSVTLVSCGDDLDGDEGALVGTWYYTDGDYIEEIIFKSDHTYIWRDKYSGESWEEAEIDKGRWTLKDGLVTVVCTEFDDTNQAVDYFIFDGKTLKYYDWEIITYKKR